MSESPVPERLSIPSLAVGFSEPVNSAKTHLVERCGSPPGRFSLPLTQYCGPKSGEVSFLTSGLSTLLLACPMG